MRAYSRVGGKIRITLPDDIETEHQTDPIRWSVIVERGEYEELRDQILEGDPVRAELKRSLDDALREIGRLQDDRDHWHQEAGNWEREAESTKRLAEQLLEERDRMTAQRDEAIKRAASIDALRPLRMTIPAELFAASADDELKATIVRQAREITALKGERE